MNETSINSAVVPALTYLNQNQAPNAAQSKTALAVSGKYWNTNTMQYSKKNYSLQKCLFCYSDSLLIAIFSCRWMIFRQSWGPTIYVLISCYIFWPPSAFSFFLWKSVPPPWSSFSISENKSIPETATWSQRCSHVSVDIKVLLYKTITIMFGYIHQISYICQNRVQTYLLFAPIIYYF